MAHVLAQNNNKKKLGIHPRTILNYLHAVTWYNYVPEKQEAFDKHIIHKKHGLSLSGDPENNLDLFLHHLQALRFQKPAESARPTLP